MNLAPLDSAITYFQSVGVHDVRTRDYEGRRELDPQCAPDEVDTQMTCECLTCGHEWLQQDTPSQCPNCGEDDMDGIEYAEVPA